MKFRTATKRDLDRLAAIHLVAYPDDRNAITREENLTRNPFGSLTDVIVGEDDGVILSTGRLFGFRTAFGGRSLRMGGIASIAVAPEARGQGHATALVEELHRRSYERGDAITMLYAFQHGFYARLGYASASSRKRLVVRPQAIPKAWRIGVRSPTDLVAIRRLYAAALLRESGWMERSRTYWERWVANDRRTLLVAPGGYVSFFVSQDEIHGKSRLEVEELVAEDPVTRRGLLAALGAFRDQVTEIVLEVAENDPLERGLVDVDLGRPGTPSVEHAYGQIVGGPMVRLGNLTRAIEARGYPVDGAFDLVVEEEALRVVVTEGRATVTLSKRPRSPLMTTRAGLAAILYGALPLADAIDLDLAESEDPRIGAILALRPLVPVDAF